MESNPSQEGESENDESVDEQSPTIQNPEVMSSEVENFKGITEAKSSMMKLASGKEKLLNEISVAKVAIRRAMKTCKRRPRTLGNEQVAKLEILEPECETLRLQNKVLKNERAQAAQEMADLKAVKQKLGFELKDLEKETEDLQEELVTLREDNRRLLKELKWKSVGKQGSPQEPHLVQDWERKLQKLEAEYDRVHQAKKVQYILPIIQECGRNYCVHC